MLITLAIPVELTDGYINQKIKHVPSVKRANELMSLVASYTYNKVEDDDDLQLRAVVKSSVKFQR